MRSLQLLVFCCFLSANQTRVSSGAVQRIHWMQQTEEPIDDCTERLIQKTPSLLARLSRDQIANFCNRSQIWHQQANEVSGLANDAALTPKQLEFFRHVRNCKGAACFKNRQPAHEKGMDDDDIASSPDVSGSGPGSQTGTGSGKSVRAIRKEYRMLSDTERRKFHDAMNTLKQQKLDGISKYDLFVIYHYPSEAPGAHGGAAFLPFHRELIKQIEVALRDVDFDVSMPYWDSTLDEGLPTPRDSILWSEDFLGNGNGFVTSGPFAHWSATKELGPGIKALYRDVGGSTFGGLYKETDLEFTRTRHNFLELTNCIDPTFELVHGLTHLFVGGYMADIGVSPNDPSFYLHHVFVDYQWEEEFRQRVQSRTARVTEYPSDEHACNSYHYANTTMKPFSIRNIDGLSNQYSDELATYALRPTCNTTKPDCGSPYLFCRQKTGSQTGQTGFRCLSKIMIGGNCSGLEGEDACYRGSCRNGMCVSGATDNRKTTVKPEKLDSEATTTDRTVSETTTETSFKTIKNSTSAVPRTQQTTPVPTEQTSRPEQRNSMTTLNQISTASSAAASIDGFTGSSSTDLQFNNLPTKPTQEPTFPTTQRTTATNNLTSLPTTNLPVFKTTASSSAAPPSDGDYEIDESEYEGEEEPEDGSVVTPGPGQDPEVVPGLLSTTHRPADRNQTSPTTTTARLSTTKSINQSIDQSVDYENEAATKINNSSPATPATVKPGTSTVTNVTKTTTTASASTVYSTLSGGGNNGTTASAVTTTLQPNYNTSATGEDYETDGAEDSSKGNEESETEEAETTAVTAVTTTDLPGFATKDDFEIRSTATTTKTKTTTNYSTAPITMPPSENETEDLFQATTKGSGTTNRSVITETSTMSTTSNYEEVTDETETTRKTGFSISSIKIPLTTKTTVSVRPSNYTEATTTPVAPEKELSTPQVHGGQEVSTPSLPSMEPDTPGVPGEEENTDEEYHEEPEEPLIVTTPYKTTMTPSPMTPTPLPSWTHVNTSTQANTTTKSIQITSTMVTIITTEYESKTTESVPTVQPAIDGFLSGRTYPIPPRKQTDIQTAQTTQSSQTGFSTMTTLNSTSTAPVGPAGQVTQETGYSSSTTSSMQLDSTTTTQVVTIARTPTVVTVTVPKERITYAVPDRRTTTKTTNEIPVTDESSSSTTNQNQDDEYDSKTTTTVSPSSVYENSKSSDSGHVTLSTVKIYGIDNGEMTNQNSSPAPPTAIQNSSFLSAANRNNSSDVSPDEADIEPPTVSLKTTAMLFIAMVMVAVKVLTCGAV